MSFHVSVPLLLGIFALASLDFFSQCKLIDGDQGSVFLAFEKTALVEIDGKEKKVKGAIFQIHNNSNCPILLTTGDASSFYKPLPSNPTVMQRIKRDIDWVLPEGALVPNLQYWYQSRTSVGKSVGGDNFFGFKLVGGRFIRFGVPFTHLDPSFANKIDVEFDYVWETENESRIKRSDVTNTVRFWVEGLPDDVKREIKKSLR